jgi:YD repeat-containing protein
MKQTIFAFALLFLCALTHADTYTYDNLNRLTSVSYPNGASLRYSYDAAGNMLTAITTPPAVGNFTLTVSVSGAGSGTVTGSGIDCGSTCSTSLTNGATATLTANVAIGSSFVSWGGACAGTAPTCSVTMSAAQAVTATFASSSPNTFTLNVTRNGTGSGSVASSPLGIDCGLTCSAVFNTGTSVTLTALPASGSTFAGWGGNCSGLSSCVLAMSTGRNVTASFTNNSGSGGSLSYPAVLVKGWNLLGNSLNQPLTVALAYGDPLTVTTVWKWDVTTAGWQFYSPEMDAVALQAYTTGKGYGVLSVINPGEGFWVNAKLDSTLGTYTGQAFALADGIFVKGWNLTATGDNVLPSVFNLALSATPPAPGTIPTNFITLWAWDNLLTQWYFYAPSLDASGTLNNYITSKGYLDFTQQNKTLGNGTGFWVNMP